MLLRAYVTLVHLLYYEESFCLQIFGGDSEFDFKYDFFYYQIVQLLTSTNGKRDLGQK